MRPSPTFDGARSRAIWTCLGKALKKAPDERYASADAFAEDLKRFLSHEPVQARPDTVAYRLSKFVERRRGGVLSALLVTVALIGTTVFALWESTQARADRDMALSEGRRARGHDAMMAFLFDDSVRQAPGAPVHKRLDRARDFIERRYRGDPDIAASLLLSLRQRYIESATPNRHWRFARARRPSPAGATILT